MHAFRFLIMLFICVVRMLICLVFTVKAASVIEYPLWDDFGQVINDFSGNGLHGVYGTNHSDSNQDPKATPKGAFFVTGTTITMPPNTFVNKQIYYKNPTSFILWIFNPYANSGMLFNRYAQNTPADGIQISIVNTDQISVSISGSLYGLAETYTSISLLDNTIWNLIVISLWNSQITLNINQQTTEIYAMTQGFQEDWSQTFTTFLMDPASGVDKLYIFSFLIVNTKAVVSDYGSTAYTGYCAVRTCNTQCPFAVVSDLGHGCISTLISDSVGLSNLVCPSTCTNGCDYGICYDCENYSCKPDNCNNINAVTTCGTLTVGCNTGFYIQNSSCIECNSDCFSCNSTYCLECTAGNSSYISPNCQCNQGYWGTLPLNFPNSYYKCNADCAQCTNSSTCTTCKDPSALPEPSGCLCISDYYNLTSLTTNGSCIKCNSDCSTCTNSSTCVICKDYYASPVVNGCQCLTGYYNLTNLTTNGTCLECNSDCFTCTNSSICSVCKDSFALPGPSGCFCISSYYNSTSLTTTGSCLACNSDCILCKNSSTCTTCKDSSALPGPSGCLCNSTYYNTTALTSTGVCLKCNSDCLDCNNPDTCISCLSKFAIPDSKIGCICEEGYINTTSLSNNTACFIQCGTGCLECNTTLCLRCNDTNSHAVGKNCTCNKGFWFSETNYSCVACDKLCSTCDALGCLTCIDPHASIVNHACPCNKNYYFNTTVSPNACYPCNASCSVCNNSITCLECKDPNAQLVDYQCYCKDYYIPNKNLCERCTKIFDTKTKACYCPDLCIDCIGKKCTSCVDNAYLKNDACVCEIFYYGNTSCEFWSFSLFVSLNSENSLMLSFTDDPVKALNQSDIKLFISNLAGYSYSLITYSIRSYLVDITYTTDVGQNSSVILIFNNPIYSIHNGNITQLAYIFKLTPVVDAYADASYKSELVATTATQATTVGSFSISALTLNFVTLWNFISILQLLCFIRLSDAILPPKFNGQLKGLKKFNMIPNIFEYILDDSQYTISTQKYKNFGYSSSIFLFNVGSWITTGLAFLLVFFLCSLCLKFSHVKPFSYEGVNKKLKSIEQSFKYGKFIRFMIQTYLEFLAASFIGLQEFNTSTRLDIANIIICIMVIILLLISPFVFLRITYIYGQVEPNKKEGLADVYSALFSEFSKENSQSASIFYCVFLLRRFLFLLFLLLIPNEFILQLCLNFALSLSVSFI